MGLFTKKDDKKKPGKDKKELKEADEEACEFC